MINYKVTAAISDSVDAPFTQPVNASGPTATDGTEFSAQLLTQTWGVFQALIAASGFAPSGTADKADASETLDAIVEQAMGRAQVVLEGGGSAADAYVVEAQATLTPQGTSTGKNGVAHSYFDGMVLTFDIAAPNTGTSTLNAFGLGVQFIKMPDGSNVLAGDLSGRLTLLYDGTNFVILASAGNSFFNRIRTGTLVEEVPGAGLEADGLRIRDGRAMFDTRLYSNLLILNNTTNPTFQVDVDAEFISVEGWQWAPGSAQVVDITVSGVGGLDTGSEAISTWYHIWAIANVTDPTTPVFGLLFSLQYTDSGVDPTLPAGYTKKAYLGAVYNNGSGDFDGFIKRDSHIVRDQALVLSGGGLAAKTVVSLVTAVPPTAKTIFGEMAPFNNTTTDFVTLSIWATSIGLLLAKASKPIQATGISHSSPFNVPLGVPQEIHYSVVGGGGVPLGSINIFGYGE